MTDIDLSCPQINVRIFVGNRWDIVVVFANLAEMQLGWTMFVNFVILGNSSWMISNCLKFQNSTQKAFVTHLLLDRDVTYMMLYKLCVLLVDSKSKMATIMVN